MDINQIRIQISTAKANVLKGDMESSLKRFIYAMHAIVQENIPLPTEMKSLIREVGMEYNSYAKIREELQLNFGYVAGEEKKMLIACMKAYEYIQQNKESEESYEDAIRRKKAIDENLLTAKDFLGRGFTEEADKAVERALVHYKDEHSIFAYIGELYLKSNLKTRAKFYYKKAVEAQPDNEEIAQKYQELCNMR